MSILIHIFAWLLVVALTTAIVGLWIVIYKIVREK